MDGVYYVFGAWEDLAEDSQDWLSHSAPSPVGFA